MPELLTICITTYNRPGYLSACLKSVLSQTFKNFRIVILDNASEQDYSGVLKKFTDPRITYVRHPHNLGGAGNFNFAFQEYTTTKYWMLFHDDDLMHPRLLEYEINLLEQNQDVVFVSTSFQAFEGELNLEFPNIPSSPDVTFCDQCDLALLLLKGFPLHFGSSMYRRDVLPGHLPNYERYAKIGDRPFLLDLVEGNKVCAILKEPFVLYRIHPGQDSQICDFFDTQIIELFRSYRKSLNARWNYKTKWQFYKTTGFELLDSYQRISPQRRQSLVKFLQRSHKAGILCFPFIIYYFLKPNRRFIASIYFRLKGLVKSALKAAFCKK